MGSGGADGGRELGIGTSMKPHLGGEGAHGLPSGLGEPTSYSDPFFFFFSFPFFFIYCSKLLFSFFN